MVLDLDKFAADGAISVYRQIVKQMMGLHEAGPAYPDSPRLAIRERLVRCFWFDQQLTSDSLRTDDGQKIRVLSPGWWNLEAGPDFRNAVIRLGRGEIVKGEVETHIRASGWNEHGHQHDPNYNSVILHVVLWNDTARKTITLQDGREVPQLQLEPYLEGQLDELAEMVNPEDYPHECDASVGECNRRLAGGAADDVWMGRFLDAAGDERMIGRAHKLWARTKDVPVDQACYEDIMEALGYKRNKSQFQMLASVATLEKLRELCPADGLDELIEQIQAALFGVAGLLPEENELGDFDDETLRAVEPLLKHWQGVAGGFGEQVMERTQWKLAGVRPANTPPRRIAAMSFILARYLRRDLLEPFRSVVSGGNTSGKRGCVKIRKEMENVLAEFPDNYWSYRSSFGGGRRETPMRLVGTSRALAIVTNVIVPALLAEAQAAKNDSLEGAVRRFYVFLPRMQENNIERFMLQRIFAGDERFETTVNSARRQQGLHQIFKDFCEQDDRGCRRCALVMALGQ